MSARGGDSNQESIFFLQSAQKKLKSISNQLHLRSNVPRNSIKSETTSSSTSFHNLADSVIFSQSVVVDGVVEVVVLVIGSVVVVEVVVDVVVSVVVDVD